jgi:hypothetical protein
MPKLVRQKVAARHMGLSIPTFIKYRRQGVFDNAMIRLGQGKPRFSKKTGKPLPPRESVLFDLERLNVKSLNGTRRD